MHAPKLQPKPSAAPVLLTPEIGEQMIYNMMNAPMREYPCPHFVCENVWPDDFFDQILAHLPSTDVYSGIIASGRIVAPVGTPETRFLFSIEHDIEKLSGEQFDFWKSVRDFLFGPRFYEAAAKKFLPYINHRFAGQNMANFKVQPVVELFRDKTDYFIGPHSDHPTRLLNLFFYLPEDDTKPHLGTSFYVQKDYSKFYKSGPHYDFEDFIRVFTAPYRRNVLAGFFKTDASFHGVEPVAEKNFDRNALAYFTRVHDMSKPETKDTMMG